MSSSSPSKRCSSGRGASTKAKPNSVFSASKLACNICRISSAWVSARFSAARRRCNRASKAGRAPRLKGRAPMADCMAATSTRRASLDSGCSMLRSRRCCTARRAARRAEQRSKSATSASTRSTSMRSLAPLLPRRPRSSSICSACWRRRSTRRRAAPCCSCCTTCCAACASSSCWRGSSSLVSAASSAATPCSAPERAGACTRAARASRADKA